MLATAEWENEFDKTRVAIKSQSLQKVLGLMEAAGIINPSNENRRKSF
jgi:hypothetical protein